MGELTNEEIVKMIGLLKSIKPQSVELKTIIQKLQQQLK